MPRNKYYYNSETCKYEEVKTKPSTVIAYISSFLLSVIVFAIVLVAVGYKFEIFQTRTMNQLKEENQRLQNAVAVVDANLKHTIEKVTDLEYNDREIHRSIFENMVDSVPESVRQGGVGGIQSLEILSNTESGERIELLSKRMDSLNGRIAILNYSHQELLQAAKEYDQMLAAIPAIQPISNKELTRLASGFGWRIHPILGVKKFHEGIDFTAKRGTPIYATGDGKITKVRTSLGGYGKEIEIDHGYGFVTKYAHMQKFNVKLGDKVKRGEIIGFVGSTGQSTAPHLHYEIKLNGVKVDPVYYFFQDLNDEQYEQILKLARIQNKMLS